MIETGNNGKMIRYGEFFIGLFFALMFGMRMWGIYESKPLYGILLVVGMTLWGMGVVFTEHNVFECLVIAALLGFGGVVYYKSGEKGLLLYFALMLGMKNIDTKKLFKWGLIAGISGLTIRVFLSAFGLIEDVAYVQHRRFVGEVFRRSLGASHPNTLSSAFAILAIMILYLVGKDDIRKVLKCSALIFLFALYLFIYSGSQTGIIITFGFICLNLFYVYRKRIGIIEKVIMVMLFPVLWLLSIIGPLLADDKAIAFVKDIDFNLGSRWEVAGYYLRNNGFSLFGQYLNNPEANIYGIDMSQLYLLLQLGVVAFIIITALWFVLIYDEVKNNNAGELVIIFTMLIMGLTDPFLYNLSFKNLAFVFMGRVFWEVIAKVSCKLPKYLQTSVIPASFGEKSFRIPNLNLEKLVINSSYCKKIKCMSVAIIVVSLVASVLVYIITPEAQCVLADKAPGEHATEVNENLHPNTYTEQQIKDIEKQGNLVLNYTDDKELMYIYYSSEEKPIEGGYYAPNVAKMEKVRLSVTVFFLGLVIVLLLRGMWINEQL